MKKQNQEIKYFDLPPYPNEKRISGSVLKNSRLLMLVVFFSIAGILSGCTRRPANKYTKTQILPAQEKFISAYTSGIIPRNETIKVRFTTDATTTENVGKEAERSYFSFTPSIKGKTYWLDTRTIEFRPDERMASGLTYNVAIDLSLLFDSIPDEAAIFPFQFATRQLDLYFTQQGLKPLEGSGIKLQQYEGIIETSEPEDNQLVEKILKAERNKKTLAVKWTHFEDGKKHKFTVDSLERQLKTEGFTLSWNGKDLGVDKKGSLYIVIPAIGDFKITDAQTYNNPEQYLQISFSDPLDPSQDLNGLIRAKESLFTYRIEGGLVKAFPTKRLTGNITLTIEPGIKNILGYNLKDKKTLSLVFEDIPPQLTALGTGSIVPNNNGIHLAFEAVNLKAVDVQITKVYEKNVLEFLQRNNTMNSDYNLEYVGKVVFEKRIPLDADARMNLRKWNRHALDLSKLVATEPGAIYRVKIRFRKDYSLYECNGTGNSMEDEEDGELQKNILTSDAKPSLWDYYNNYDYNYYYNNSDVDGPCGSRYYYYNNAANAISQSILASDLGMISKRGTDGSMLIAVTNLKTTEPLANVTLEIYDFQKQLVKKVITDNKGFAFFNTEEQVFAAIAKYGSQRGYLQLNNNTLNLSRFDISGEAHKKGVKGFIYTDRGVWRPGDSIYISFILEDKKHALPINYPISFELNNPRGQTVQKQIKKSSVNGFYTFHTATELNAPTGNYYMKINVGGVVFDKTLKVETITPNRLKLKLDFKKENFDKDDKIFGSLNVKWLHGSAAKNLDAEVNVALYKTPTIFTAFKDYVFDDPQKEYYTETTTLFNKKLDNYGNADIPNKINISSSAPGVLSAIFYCKVTEPGGSFSTDNFITTYHPYKQYAGIKLPKGDGDIGVLFTDQVHTIDIATVDKNGNAINSTVNAYLYKLEWRWWWDYNEDAASYNSRVYSDPVASSTINTQNGKGKWQIKVPENEYGRYLIKVVDKKGHSAGCIVYIDHPGWQNRRDETMKGTTMLSLNTNKEKYTAGETASIEIPSGYKGTALVTLESGTRVLQADWVKTQAGITRYSFKITPEMAPNVYAYVTLMQPHGQVENDMPLRLYGVIPVKVENPASHLEPEIKLPEVIKPEEKLTFFVKEKKGKQMTYTIAMVDEGLLDLTKFNTPDPWNNFYAKEALQVQTTDLFDQVLGNYASKIKKLLSIGGDGSEDGAAEGTKVQRFKPMVKFLGPFNLSANKTAKHTINIPRYTGSVRTMIIAGDNGAYGSSEVTTPVRKPLMILGTLPRVLGPNEEVSLPVSVIAMEDFIKEVKISLKTNDLLNINGPAVQNIHFSEKGEELVTFPIKVKPETGIASLEITATSGNETAKYDIELQVRAPNPAVTRNTETIIKEKGTQVFPYESFGIKGTGKGSLEISSIPPLNLENRLNYLIEYPHGCIEQTTSSVFPQLFVMELLELKPEQKKQIEKNIKAGIERLRLFQLHNGSMSYWPESGGYEGASEWGTNYAGHFLLEAQMKGYNVPQSLLEKWIIFQKEAANNWNTRRKTYRTDYDDYYDNDDLTQAYRLYLLSLAKVPQTGAMNRLRELKDLSATAKWQLAAAYFIAGQKTIAQNLVKNLALDIPTYNELSNTYGSDIRDEAMILEVLTRMGEREKAFQIVRKLSNILKTENWMSTQETAYSLLAITRYGAKNIGKGIQLEYKINGGNWQKINTSKSVYQIPVDIKNQPKGKIEIRNNSAGILYANLAIRAIPVAGKEINENKEVNLEVTYKNLQGKVIQPDVLEQGTDFIAEIKVTNPGVYKELDEMALTAIFPSGWQLHNPRMTGDQFKTSTSVPEYLDIKDDRAYYYFDLKEEDENYSRYRRNYYDNISKEEEEVSQSNIKVFRIMLNASFIGKYYMPGIYTEAMYKKGIHASKAGKWVTVVKAGSKSL